MEDLDRHANARRLDHPRRHITRSDARIAFALEMLPLPVFGAFYGMALAVGDGPEAGFFAAIGLVSLIASGLGWSYLGESVTAAKVFVARLLCIVVATVAVIGTSFTPLGVILAGAGFVIALTTPALSALMLSLRWWPRTNEPV
ncbi:MAG: hypothetical protein WEB52_11850 [Dehalococcoidia bacterium]